MTASSPLQALRSAWQASAETVSHAAGIGIDLVEVETLQRLINSGGPAFLDAGWTAGEQQDANGRPEGLAGKWAAKEAVMKALQHGIGDVDPLDVEIVATSLGAPAVVLHRTARAVAEKRKIAAWHVSVTHEGGWAAAIAVASARHLQLADTTVAAPEGRNNG
jgi:holo-[acyl-carrier protein] synthase